MPKYFARLSRVRLSCDILANLQCKLFATLVRMSYDCSGTVLKKTCEHLATIWRKLSDIHTNVVRPLTNVSQLSYKLEMKIELHSWERRENYRATVARYNFKIRPKFANLLHKYPFNDTAT